MKKIFLYLIPFLLLGCSFSHKAKWEVDNESSVVISFTIPDSEKITLKPSESYSFELGTSDTISLLDHPRVSETHKYDIPFGQHIIYSDMEYKNVNVYNPNNFDIILAETNGFLGDNYGDTVTIPNNGKITVKLYTTKPQYIATTIIDNIEATVSTSLLIFY